MARRYSILNLNLILILLAAAGCSNVNVEATSEDQLPHEKIFSEDLEGRSPDYQGPRVVKLPDPAYPATLYGQAPSGLILVRVLVGFDGRLEEAEVTQGLQAELDQAALEAARGGTYAPATESGIATEGWVTVPFRYPPDQAGQ